MTMFLVFLLASLAALPRSPGNAVDAPLSGPVWTFRAGG